MPTVQLNGFRLYYEEHPVNSEGERNEAAETFLLIMGFGWGCSEWGDVIPLLARDHHVVAFDNRGAGRSEMPEAPAYPVTQMSDDAVALLDHLGLERVHVWGVSMGGMIAQELALAHPKRIATLTLGCTTAGGRGQVPTSIADRDEFFRLGSLSPADAAVEALPLVYGSDFLEANRARLSERAVAQAPSRASLQGRRRQFAGARYHDTTARLANIAAPTLVATGLADRVINPANSRILADAIPGTELVEYPGAGHVYWDEDPERVVGDIRRFAQRHNDLSP
ncbi:MAG: alpha/beta fold hydrolase [Dehalococcoidia bacterium]